MSVLVSVIVPVHNVESFLPHCLHSITGQTHVNLEILCIDDASTDRSYEILEQFQRQDSRIHLIRLERNFGLGFVRNLGIEKARGEYCCFVDGDDFIDPTFVECLLKSCIAEKSDIAKCQVLKTSTEGTPVGPPLFPDHVTGNYTTLNERLSLFNFWFGTTNSLIRTAFLTEHQIRFLEDGRLFEDFIFFLKAYYFANQISYFDDHVFYYYRHRPGSINNDPVLRDKRTFDSLHVTAELLSFCDQKGILLGEKKHIIRKYFLSIASDFIFESFLATALRRQIINLLKRARLLSAARRVLAVARFLNPKKNISRISCLASPVNVSLNSFGWVRTIFSGIDRSAAFSGYDLSRHFTFLRRRNAALPWTPESVRLIPVNLCANPNVSLETFFVNGSYHELHANYVFWGASHISRHRFDRIPGKILLCEDGFLSGIETWANSRKNKRFYFCCSFILDDLALHYSAHFPSRLELALNEDFSLNQDQRQRVERAMAFIRAQKISKYNFQPLTKSLDLGERTKRVLVIDQSYGDASIINSNANPNTFFEMLKAAVRENPSADIIVKSHPDAVVPGPRTGYYDASILSLSDRIQLVNEPLNPITLLEQVDRVYVCSSGVGMEALLCGREVVTFGVPFYAGWGLTDDRNELFRSSRMKTRRAKKRSVEELFFKAFIEYSIYKIDELLQAPCTLESVLDFIVKKRDEYFEASPEFEERTEYSRGQ